MARYIVQRLLLLPILLLVFSFIVFALVQAPPGDFLTSYIATLASSGSSMDDAGVAADRAPDARVQRAADDTPELADTPHRLGVEVLIDPAGVPRPEVVDHDQPPIRSKIDTSPVTPVILHSPEPGGSSTRRT